MTGDGRERPGWHPLLAVVAAALAVSVPLTLFALGSDEKPDAGIKAAGASKGPFRGNVLPDGIRNKKAPALRLRDVRGGSLATDELRGRPYVVTFLYTDCPDVCPLIGQELGDALRLLGHRANEVAVVAVSVDPSGDTPEAVTAWLERHRLPANFHYLIGSEAELRPAWKSYFVGPQRQGVEQSLHTASIWLIDAAGRWRTKFSGGAPVLPRDIAHDLRVLMDDNDASTKAGAG